MVANPVHFLFDHHFYFMAK